MKLYSRGLASYRLSRSPSSNHVKYLRPTNHQQICKTLYGTLKFYNLSLYIDELGRQCGRAMRSSIPMYFRKEGKFWVQFK